MSTKILKSIAGIELPAQRPTESQAAEILAGLCRGHDVAQEHADTLSFGLGVVLCEYEESKGYVIKAVGAEALFRGKGE